MSSNRVRWKDVMRRAEPGITASHVLQVRGCSVFCCRFARFGRLWAADRPSAGIQVFALLSGALATIIGSQLFLQMFPVSSLTTPGLRRIALSQRWFAPHDCLSFTGLAILAPIVFSLLLFLSIGENPDEVAVRRAGLSSSWASSTSGTSTAECRSGTDLGVRLLVAAVLQRSRCHLHRGVSAASAAPPIPS